VPGRLRIFVAWAAIAAWSAASGLSWDLLQVAAWVNMSAANARTMTAGAAVAKTLTDEACPMCKAAAEGRAKSEQSPLAQQDAAKAKLKAEAAMPVLVADPSVLVSARLRFASDDRSSITRSREVPVPPPKALV